MNDPSLHDLARKAGIEVEWEDVDGNDLVVSDESLRGVLRAIGFPAGTDDEVRDSTALLREERDANLRPLITAHLGQEIPVNKPVGRYKLTLESGVVHEGVAHERDGRDVLPGIDEPGYHRLECGDARTTVAVAPAQGYTLADAACDGKLWGLAVQLYALRGGCGGGLGDFKALEEFTREAARQGADAIAISPVHALFSADVSRFAPYAPSNRAALNVLHVAEPTEAPDDAPLVDWPLAAAAKLKALRQAYDNLADRSDLQKFRDERGPPLERHAIFEALAASLVQHNRNALDWRNWPVAYQNPEHAAVLAFAEENAEEVGFHAYLQYRADAGLAAAQKAARDGGMKIGLIADLAVGTDHAGSHSWTRQDEVLRGLEIGAPPDYVNREGQSWGITAFSPRGLRNSGFSAFIDMLRHALRHAGGVRIDHVMGLARLWVIPLGFPGKQGAYLKMPVDDLMRLVALESHRNKAVILGEDLGTLPHGFQSRLDRAGIAGLRVLWFERAAKYFTPPKTWAKASVAMTTTHDLPTVAGWWEGKDIAWRERLGFAGDTKEIRAEERGELWGAFHASGATSEMIPAEGDGQAATYPACAHIATADSDLVLLPVEDMLSLNEQPNLPGTMDEHPNWRRRLDGDASSLFARADVQARLKVLDEKRGTA